ncbi:DUF4190 domain-containing protein [Nocardioides marmoriginsengisoli]|uniref:DUF4190 domain-containing protein n=1 Tax=Nocardioides marmoriginsengisoli TaxID=661483 RepID=A0A3N0CCD6_9ACTN|nr:DUF4190 domain-containing protein [Nocardioides marmoriginsengisoli]RNL61117.1 DUF4190 domain-containing protein [Nocardioides marmoriginsengisoli]
MSDQTPEDPQQTGPVFNPQSGFPTGDATPPVPGENPYAQPGYPPPPYGQQPYPPAPYGQAPYDTTQNPYGQQYPQPGYGYPAYAPQNHPRATTSLVLGLIGVVGAFTCVFPVLVAPFAWVIAAKARREIRESPGRYGGEGSVTAGFVLGIIGTILLALIILFIIGMIIWAATDPNSFNDTFDDGTTV